MIDFTEEELQRYSRHILLQEVGAEGQERIRRGRVLVIGVGGLGSPVALYLAAAGVGTIGIADGDTVDFQPATPGDTLHAGRGAQQGGFRRRETAEDKSPCPHQHLS